VRSGKLRLLTLPFLALIGMALSVSPAYGAFTHPLKKTFGPFKIPSSIAIDGANGNVFVADANDAIPRIKIFGPGAEGPPIGVKVSEMPLPPPGAGEFLSERAGIAIDNSAASPSKGALYVTDQGHRAVAKYVLNPLSEEYESKGLLVPDPELHVIEPLAIAVDAKGNVFFSSRGTFGSPTPPILEFDPEGKEVKSGRIEVSTSTNEAKSLAFDSAGNLYVGADGVWKFAANAEKIEPGTTPTQLVTQAAVPGEGAPSGIAIDQGPNPDALYVALDRRVVQYSTACVPVDGQCAQELEFGFGILGSTRRIAVSPLDGDIYVTDRGNEDVAIFSATLAIVPDVSTEATTDVKEASATLNGTISPAGGPPASCEFEYMTEASFKAEGFDGAISVPCAPPGPFSGNEDGVAKPGEKVKVKADLSGLGAETTYVYRLFGKNLNGPSFGQVLSFGTVGKPKIDASAISHVTLDSAIVEGLVNPNGGPGTVVEPTYTVEYVSEADFKASGYTNATKLPPAGAPLGSGIKDIKVAQQLSGLTAFTTYHFRIVAKNEAGEEQGPDKTFTTYIEGAVGLPDGRAYEQATPVNKGGANPRGAVNFVQAGSGEGGITGITFVATGGIPGGVGSQRFPSYLAHRASDGSGWATQGLLPPASNGSKANVRGYSEDLSQTYVTQAEPGFLGSFYQRDTSTLQMREMVSGVSDLARDYYAGASDDGSLVLLETLDKPPLPSGAVEGLNTYVWDRTNGTLALVGVLNEPEEAPSGGTSPGSYAGKGGGKYTLYENAISDSGSRVFFTSIATHQIYLRQNPTEPQSAMAGGKCTEATMACTLQISASQRTAAPLKDEKPSTLWLATPDGAKAFFTSSGKLTNNAKTGSKDEGNDLYRYDANSGKLTDLTVDTNPGDPNGVEVQGVLGSSKDGSYVYFVANGVLTGTPNAEGQSAEAGDCKAANGEIPETTTGHCNLYLWHEGDISFVARQHPTANALQSDATNWLRGPAPALGEEKTARVASDGLTLLFSSQEELTAYDNQGFNEVYRYRADSGDLACVSCNPTGATPVASASVQGIHNGISDSTPAPTQTRNLSIDGNRVFFESPDRLVVGDTNGEGGCPRVNQGIFSETAPVCLDVYEWEAKGTGSCESESQNGGCLHLLSTGTSPEPSYFGDASRSGNDAYIFTFQPLVLQDKDELVDIYDARVGGGIKAQNEPTRIPCPSAEACLGSVPTPPATPSPPKISGPGDPLYCKKGQKKVKKHGEVVCVKKKSHAKKNKKSQKHRATGKHG
jgi:hypothetical protein